jgi:hypothetical protein
VATTGADGVYDIRGVPQGRYVVLPRHPEHYLPQLAAMQSNMPYAPDAGGAQPALTAVVTGDDSRVERDLLLARGIAVSGHVVDGEGRARQARGRGGAWAWATRIRHRSRGSADGRRPAMS